MVIADGEGRFLTVRQRGGPFKGAWLLPGGGLEEGESPEEAARREVREETGLEILSLRHIRRYEVHFLEGEGYFGHVDLFSGAAQGSLRAAHPEEPTEWVRPGPGLHPLLLRELRDAGLIAMDDEEIERISARTGLRMTSLGEGGGPG